MEKINMNLIKAMVALYDNSIHKTASEVVDLLNHGGWLGVVDSRDLIDFSLEVEKLLDDKYVKAIHGDIYGNLYGHLGRGTSVGIQLTPHNLKPDSMTILTDLEEHHPIHDNPIFKSLFAATTGILDQLMSALASNRLNRIAGMTGGASCLGVKWIPYPCMTTQYTNPHMGQPTPHNDRVIKMLENRIAMLEHQVATLASMCHTHAEQ